MISETATWVVPVVAGVFTLLGLVVSQTSNYFADKRRTGREQALDVRQIVSIFLTEVDTYRRKIGKPVFSHNITDSPSPTTPMYTAYAQVELSCPGKITNAARDLYIAALAVSMHYKAEGSRKYSGDFEKARRTLINATRHELGLPTVDQGGEGEDVE